MDEEARLNAIRDALIETVEQHRRECNDPRCVFVGNTLAWLAHATGATAADVRAFAPLLAKYELECVQSGGCRHHGG